MTKLEENWRVTDERHDSLTESEFEEIMQERKITIEEVRKWASDVKQLKISGGLKRRGWSQHDIDFWLDLPTNKPWGCPCRDLLKKLSKPEFGLPVRGWCGGCGASINWNDDDKRWEWYWDYTKYEIARGEFEGGITEDDIEGVKKRLDKLEGR